jgi:DNA gyrase/topoisomerase IV subunit B
MKGFQVPCGICGAMVLPESMETHMKIHTDRKKEECKVCFKSFLDLKTHMALKHSETKSTTYDFQGDESTFSGTVNFSYEMIANSLLENEDPGLNAIHEM